jgi:outer membrane receptor protein involved in Fe transport
LKKIISLLGSAAVLLGSWQFAIAEDSDGAIEEVVVTGSYLKRSSENSPSPLSVVTSADIEDLGAQGMAEIINTMPWQSGSETRSATFNGAAGLGQMTVNLRNLGMSSTLVLVNGKRNVATFYDGNSNAAVNIQGLVPTIALERMEVVKDGASALYGSDAIAGVVNFITKKNFEGLDVQFEHTTLEQTSEGDTNNMQMVFGAQGDRGGVVFSAGAMSRSMVTVGDLYSRHGGSTVSSTGQPGRMFPTDAANLTWAANGLNPGALTDGKFPRNPQGTSYGNADPSCEAADALDNVGGSGLYANGVLCAYDFGPFFPLQGDESSRQMFLTGHYDLTDNIELYMEAGSNGSEFFRYNSLNPNAVSLTIPTSNLGLIQDAANRGIVAQPLRNGTRMMGRTVYDSGTSERPLDTYSQVDRSMDRIQIGADISLELGGREWDLDVSYTRSMYNMQRTELQDTQSVEFELAINGMGGPNCDPFNGTAGSGNAAYASSGGDFGAGNCYYFNPFGNSVVSPDGVRQTDLTLVNPPELYQYLLGRVTSDTHFEQDVFDAVLSGTVADLDSGAIGLAVGLQHRVDYGRTLYDATMNSGNLDFVYGATDWSGTLTNTAVFAEVGLPLGENIDVNLAVRYEEFDELGTDTTDPKLTVLWRITDTLTARASGGSSYRVGSIQQLFGRVTTVHNMTDFGTNGSAYKPSLTVGNDKLRPESADMWNVGFSWVPEGALEGFQLDADYYSYEYTDILSRESYLTLVAADNAVIEAAIAVGGTHEGDAVAAIAAGVGNREQVLRTGSGRILRVLPNFVNQNSADISGLDIQANYSFDNSLGAWKVGLAAALAQEYKVAGQKDSVGMYNVKNPVTPRRALPEWKINGSLNWSLNNHRAYAVVRYIDGYEATLSDEPASGFWNNTIKIFLDDATAAKYYNSNVDSFVTVDAQYTYTLPEVSFLSSSTVTLGAKNLFDEEAPWVPNNTSYDPVTHDFRGRVWYVRVGASM